jgi:hypothetical protein
MSILLFNDKIDLSSPETPKTVGTKLLNLLKPIIDGVIQQINNNTFDYLSFTFNRKLHSGLTDHCGFYLIINEKTKKVYLGSTSDLAQRKGEHNKNLKNLTSSKLSINLRKDRDKYGPESFYFVPLLRIPFSNFEDLLMEPNSETKNTQRKIIAKFLETNVETLLLEFYLNSENKDMFYNVKVIGEFQPFNTFGGSPNSGSPSKNVSFQNYAWESISSASKSLSVDRHTIRNRIDNGIMKILSGEEFNNFSGNKILNQEGETYFLDKPEEYQRLRKSL